MDDLDDSPQPPARPRRPHFAAVMLAVVVIAGASIAFNETMRRSDLADGSIPLTQVHVGAPFRLVDQNGRQVSDTTFAGRKRLMIFAAASERDRILATLQVLNSARDLAGPKAADLAYIWITTDPDNDEPAKLASVLAEAGGKWAALTGNNEAIRSLMHAYFVPDAKVPTSPSHAKGAPPTAVTIAYLMDENGAFLSHRTVPPDPAAVAQWLSQSL